MRRQLMARALVFCTFFGSCAVIALLAAALGTRDWVTARPSRPGIPLAVAHIAFGLFDGRRELDFGYGLRTQEYGVRSGTHPARRWAWAGAAALLSGALVAAAGASVLAALAAPARSPLAPRPLLLANLLAAALGLAAAAVWLAEFQLRLQHNVLSEEDLSNGWSSEGAAELGVSFWLAVGAGLLALVDAALVGAAAGGAPPAPPDPPSDDKLHANIMLY